MPRQPLLCLRIDLEGPRPPIWRRLWIGADVRLIDLHHAIQAAMGWTDAHLHEFQIGAVTYATPDPEDEDFDSVVVDERDVRLGEVLRGVSHFGYLYDFGDHWQHRIGVERLADATEIPPTHGFVEAGERACPPEDCGGADAYQAFLGQFAKSPRSRDVREFLEWAGEDFDASRFDRHAANAALERMAWNRWVRS
ncbi:MAG: plasmid pRiA4b ORF-3 family protein [Burkholderiales bacterium]